MITLDPISPQHDYSDLEFQAKLDHFFLLVNAGINPVSAAVAQFGPNTIKERP